MYAPDSSPPSTAITPAPQHHQQYQQQPQQGYNGAGGAPPESELENSLLALYQGLTEMQTLAAETAKGDEALIAKAT